MEIKENKSLRIELTDDDRKKLVREMDPLNFSKTTAPALWKIYDALE